MKKKYIVVILLLFILCGCSIYDKELKIDYEAIKEEKPHDIEEGSEIQKEETLIHNENTVVNQMEKPYGRVIFLLITYNSQVLLEKKFDSIKSLICDNIFLHI